MLLARDIMTRDVVTIHYSASVRELAKLLAEKGITGVPVVNEEKRLLGVISMRDLIAEEVRNIGANLEYQDIYELFTSALNVEETEGVSVRQLWVESLMRREVFTATETTPVREICRIMYEKNVHRIPIIRDGTLIGLVTAMDIVRTVAQSDL